MQKNFYIFLFVICVIATAVTPLDAQWTGWNYRRTITVDNNSGSILTDFQVKISLNSSNFTFAHAKSDGSDLRITSSDGITEIPFWIETWNAAGNTATIWVKIPSIVPPPTTTTIYLYYGNASATSSANGDNTFEFFDDFSSSVTVSPGYYDFGPASTIMVQETTWGESSAPHTLSVVKAPSVGAYNNYIYYGYYGPQASGYIGIAGSNDLISWTRFPYNPPPAGGINNPLFTGSGVRWPSVFFDESANKYYMVHTMNYGSSYIVYRESTDGLTWTAPTTIVPYDVSNQNPSLFHDPVSNKYYLYWYRAANGWSIMAREANTVAELVSAPNVELLRSSTTLAAPQVLYYDNTYFLSTEINPAGWQVRIYAGSTPLGPFTMLPGNPVLIDGCACLFQHLFNGSIYEYYCKQATNGTWTLDMRVVNPSTGRIMYEQGQIDGNKWTPDGGNWNVTSAIQPDGVQGYVALGSTSSRQILKSLFTGTDYILEGYGKQISSVVWGFGIRTTDNRNTYSLNLYDNHDDTDNYYFYRWSAGSAIEVWKTPLGIINPNNWYKLMIKAHSNNFDIYLNDIYRATTTNNSFSSGSIALYGESGTVAQFDDVRVRKYASSEPVPTVGPEYVNPLPVELSSFSASIIGSSVKLNWRTETEVNNYGFEIHRQTQDDNEWTTIGFVNGNGNSNSPKTYSYEDNTLIPGKYSYRLKQIDNDGQFEFSKIIEVDFNSPKIFELTQNYPNPFNPKTSIRFSIPETGNVKLSLYNPLGQEVCTILNEVKESGTHLVNFDASELNSGMYIYKLESGSFVQSKKMILIK